MWISRFVLMILICMSMFGSAFGRPDAYRRHFEQAQRFGARILKPPADMPFGERMYTAEDPGGHRWTFSQSIADVPPEHWGATTARSEQ